MRSLLQFKNIKIWHLFYVLNKYLIEYWQFFTFPAVLIHDDSLEVKFKLENAKQLQILLNQEPRSGSEYCKFLNHNFIFAEFPQPSQSTNNYYYIYKMIIIVVVIIIKIIMIPKLMSCSIPMVSIYIVEHVWWIRPENRIRYLIN